MSNHAHEGDDIPDEAPLRVNLFGEQFVAVDNPEIMASASGPRCLETLSLRLLRAGFDSGRKMTLFRAGERIGSTTIAAASQSE
jgi:hypothetical protein